jgi:electron transfer flavoprotein alpha subunit
MSKALVLAEHDKQRAQAFHAQRGDGGVAGRGSVDVLVVGSGCADVARQASAIAGVGKVLVADAPQFADGLAENVAPQLLALAGGYTHLFAPASSSGKNIMPRVAAKLDSAQISDAIAVLGPDTYARPIYAGNAIATVQCADAIIVATVRRRVLRRRPTAAAPRSRPWRRWPTAACRALSGREVAKSDRPDLQSAKVVVSGGRGLGSAENFKLLEQLAERLHAALGASRAAVDAGYAPNDWQVGQTGKIVAPQLYIAVGISGAIQHLAGMKDSKVIVAINKDPDAPIFQVADYGLVADLFAAVPEMMERL